MDFDLAFDRLMGHEGELSMTRKDPGNWTKGYIGGGVLKGTKYGISAATYPNEDIANLTPARAKFLFRRDFWDRIKADKFRGSVAWQMADFAYHSGPETAIRKLQSAVGVADDGKWGPISAAAIKKMSETDIIMRLIARRLRFMNRLKNWQDASRGWTNRMADNLDYGAVDT